MHQQQGETLHLMQLTYHAAVSASKNVVHCLQERAVVLQELVYGTSVQPGPPEDVGRVT